jgi:3-oxoacyl-[acyl-carrier protein] reductase
MTDKSALRERVALVTGASRGVGRAVALRLAREGADIAFSYLNSRQQAAALVEELKALGVRAAGFRADSGSLDEAVALVEHTVTELGRLDILVHNAATFVTGRIDDPERDDEVYHRQFAVNAHSVAAITRTAAAHLGDGGRIVLVSSVGAERGGGSVAHGDYSASKAAIEAYSRSWAHEFGPSGITVNTVQLGAIDTDMLAVDPAVTASLIPVRRIGTPEDVAAAIAYLAGPEAGYISGATLRIDGGRHA